MNQKEDKIDNAVGGRRLKIILHTLDTDSGGGQRHQLL